MQAKTLQTPGSRRPHLVAAMAVITAIVAVSFMFVGTTLAAPDLQPKTTHPVQGRENCMMCHTVGGGAKPSPANHAAYKNEICLTCHPAAEAPAAPAAPSAPTAATQAPSSQSIPSQPAAAAAPQAAAPAAAPATAPSCMDCHKNPNLFMELPSGEKLSLTVNEEEMASSVHGDKLSCTDCHSRITGYPHKKVQVNSIREYSIAQYETCKRCHFTNYTKTLDGAHFQIMESGNQNAPLCTDCHGSHNVTDPDQPRSKISLSCAKCHTETYDTYAKSVHGASLVKDENKDVPVCTDCHGTHVIRDPNSPSFRLDSPEMCAKCHSNPELMAKYDLSPNVYKTYTADFHGATVALTKRQGANIPTEAAVCSDCHGVHDIVSVKNGNPAEVKQRALESCQKCHADAGTNFPDAWMGHYEISMEKTPLPWLVRAFYWTVIPFMLGGLVLHIVVDLWRIARNR